MRVFVAGATGFIGRPLVRALALRGDRVVALARDPGGLRGLDGVEPVHGDFADPDTYRGRILGCDASVHLVGLLKASRKTFERVVARGTRDWVQACRDAGVRHLVYVSAIGAAADGTPYQRSKWAAEEAVRASGVPYTIFRPSFVLGPGGFVEQIDRLLRFRVLPLFGRQDYRATPVARDDLVAAIAASLREPAARGRVFHMGGPQAVTYEDIVRAIRDTGGRRAALPQVPKWLGFTAAGLLGWFPGFPADVDNLRMLLEGNEAPENDWERTFGIRATPFRDAVQAAVAGLRGEDH